MRIGNAPCRMQDKRYFRCAERKAMAIDETKLNAFMGINLIYEARP